MKVKRDRVIAVRVDDDLYDFICLCASNNDWTVSHSVYWMLCSFFKTHRRKTSAPADENK